MSILSHPRYHLIRCESALKVAGVGGVWYDIRLLRKVQREDRAGFSDPLKLQPEPNKAFKGRADLKVELKAGGAGRRRSITEWWGSFGCAATGKQH